MARTRGARLHDLVRRLYPFCRSITGDGLRRTLREVQAVLPIALHEVPSGTPVLDWEVPKEWNIRGARIESLSGQVVVDFADSNLHVVGYSAPVDAIVTREELSAHVHTLPNKPDLVPYRTAYYANTWGFCLAHRIWEGMKDPTYRVVIDSSLTEGSLTYGELIVPGREQAIVLLSAHCCHPSLANDNLSGIALACEIGRHLLSRDNRLTYRILFIPATIGSLTWLARNEGVVARIAHGLVLSCVGDPGSFHYKRSRRGNAVIDRAVAHVLSSRMLAHSIMAFSPLGYDERQYCSPGYNLPVGCLMRSPNGSFPEYHTSADNLDFVTPRALKESFDVLAGVLELLERNVVYERVDGRGEPQLGRRGLYRAISGQREHENAEAALLWVLNLADGRHNLLDVAEESGLAFEQIVAASDIARRADLVRRAKTQIA